AKALDWLWQLAHEIVLLPLNFFSWNNFSPNSTPYLVGLFPCTDGFNAGKPCGISNGISGLSYGIGSILSSLLQDSNSNKIDKMVTTFFMFLTPSFRRSRVSGEEKSMVKRKLILYVLRFLLVPRSE